MVAWGRCQGPLAVGTTFGPRLARDALLPPCCLRACCLGEQQPCIFICGCRMVTIVAIGLLLLHVVDAYIYFVTALQSSECTSDLGQPQGTGGRQGDSLECGAPQGRR